MRFLRTFRRDDADLQAFAAAAEPGEWAVSGAFVFSEHEPAMLIGRDRQAFRAGFLGTRSFGWSSHAEVVEISPADYEAVIEALAAHLVEHFDAPDHAAARAFAEEECRFVQSLCDRPAGALLTVDRSFGPQGIVERFKTVEEGE
jgi:hypothetical protein